MKSRFARLGVLLAFVGLMATMAPPASATNVQNVTFVGTATLSGCPGLGYPGPGGTPGQPEVTTKTGPKNEPEVNVKPTGGNHCDFTFIDNTCVKTSVGKTTGIDTDCDIFATGKVWGFCGLSHGKGTVQIESNKQTISGPFSFNAVGGVLVASGGDRETNFYGEVIIVQTGLPLTGKCMHKRGRGFSIAGEFVIKDCTNGTTAGVCNP